MTRRGKDERDNGLDWRPADITTAWGIDAAVGVFALVIFFLTAAGTITWRNEAADSGELVSAAYVLGIPHPPGYPLYMLVASVLTHLPIGDPAKNVGVLSAVASAGAVILLSHCLRRSDGCANVRGIDIVAPAVALLVGLAPSVWSQATVAEVYALNTLFVVALLAVSLGHSPRRLSWAAAIAGLGLAHHLTIALLFPTAIILLSDQHWTRSEKIRAAVLFVLPLAFYLYLPWRAAAHPPINWGDPETLDGFLWTVTAAPYRTYLLGLTPGDLIGRFRTIAFLLFQQFQVWGIALGLWGVWQAWVTQENQSRRRLWAFALAIGLIGAYAVVYGSRDSYIYLTPLFVVVAFWIATGLRELLEHVTDPRMQSLAAIAILCLPAYNLIVNYQTMDLSRDRQAIDYARTTFETASPDAVVLADGDEHLFALWYYRYVDAGRSSRVFVVSSELLEFDWYWDQVRAQLSGLGSTAAVAWASVPSERRSGQIVTFALNNGKSLYLTARQPWMSLYKTRDEGPLIHVLDRKY